MIAGSPTIGFLGFAVLDPIYGNDANTNLVIGIVSIVVNAVTIPIGLALINKGQAEARAKASKTDGEKVKIKLPQKSDEVAPVKEKEVTVADGIPVTDAEAKALREKGIIREIDLVRAETHNHLGNGEKKTSNSTMSAIINAIKKPVAAAPLLAFVLVLLGIKIPASFAPSFDLIAKANSGVAVLAAGLSLSTVKFSIDKESLWNTFYRLLLTPAIIVLVAYLCGMGSDPTKISMLCLANALPPAFSGIIISSRYNIYVREGASSVAISTVAFAATCIFWIWLLPILAAHF